MYHIKFLCGNNETQGLGKLSIKSSDRRMVSHKGSTLYITQKTHKKLMGKIMVGGKRLNLGVRGPGEKPFWGETRSSGTGGSHPGHLISLRSPGAKPIIPSH